ncbi:piwi-like protein Siwi [Diachasmimorpha longicaudata]|uniref:piwi-like protein Siwi n=1 Tax=Diachasmimorpha longicaudata TaxID=58733 RepID=UPI0030B8A943
MDNPEDNKENLVPLKANYFKILCEPDCHLHRYQVKFEPEEDSYKGQKALIEQHRDIIGTYILDGTTLYCTHKPPLEFPPGEEHQIIAEYLGNLKPEDYRSEKIYNLLASRTLEIMDFQMIGWDFYDIKAPEAKVNIENYALEVWTGYRTAIQNYEDGLMMAVDISHKVVAQTSIFDLLEQVIENSGPDYQAAFIAEVTGLNVWTEYDNKINRIDGVDFSMTPLSNVKTEQGELPMTYKEYYKVHHEINISHNSQPLLVVNNRPKNRQHLGEKIYLIPELCARTGLTPALENDRIVKDLLSAHTVSGPENRMKKLMALNHRMINNKKLQDELRIANMNLDSELIDVFGKILPREKLIFGDGCQVDVTCEGDWSVAFKENNLFQTVKLEKWVVVTPAAHTFEVKAFVEKMMRSTRNFQLSEPDYVELEESTLECYSSHLQQSIMNINPQLVMIVVQGRRPEVFTRIMRKCYFENAVPCQVITDKCFMSEEPEDIATKVTFQLSCKIGGIPWSIHIPLNGLMIVGISVARDTDQPNRSFAAVVVTLDKGLTRYFSSVSCHDRNDQLTFNIISSLSKALEKYHEANNGSLPSRIIVYRNSAQNSHVSNITEHEATRVYNSLKNIYGDAPVSFAYILVSMYSNTRLFHGTANPPLGTVVENIITQPMRKDFFLVSQHSKDDTVMPCYYNVIFDTARLSMERIQILTYKLTHVYFNCSNTVRRPAPVHYAHKLASRVAENIHAPPDRRLEDLLYFL